MAMTRPIQALQFFQERLGLTPFQAAGLVGNLMQESTQALDPSIIGDNGASLGIAQWQGPRRRALVDFAARRGTDPTDFNTQLEFLAHEAETTESASIGALRRAENIGDAAAAGVGFFRPSKPMTERRQRLAMQVARMAGAGGDLEVIPTSGTPQSEPQGLLASLGVGGNEPQGLLASLGGASMANNDDASFLERAAGPGGFLSSEFLGNLGAGILAANAQGVPLGGAIGQGLLKANQATGSAVEDRLRNEAIRQQLTQASRKREATAELRALMESDPSITAGDSRVRSLLFEIDPESAIETLTPRQPKGLEARFAATEQALGRPLTPEEIRNMSGAAGEAGQLAVPLSATDLSRMRLPNGAPLPLGTTLQQAIQLGARVLTADDQKRLAKADAAFAVLDELEGLAVGPNGIFTGVDRGLLEQGVAALEFALDDLTRSDPRVSRFNDLRGATVGPLIRMLGESGALADGDVRRALGLLPSTGSLNPFNPSFADSEEAARAKFDTLRRIIEKGIRNLREGRPAEDSGSGASPSTGDAEFNYNPSTRTLEPAR